MYLSKFTDYGLRVLVFLALEPERKVTIGEVSDHFAMPRNHVMKVVQSLAAHGFVETQPGKKGGIRLPPQWQDLGVGIIVRRMERSLDIIDCDSPHCPITGACGLKTALDQARDAFLAVLDGYRLGDLLVNRSQLARLFGLEINAKSPQ